jgi:hypothetical protein
VTALVFPEATGDLELLVIIALGFTVSVRVAPPQTAVVTAPNARAVPRFLDNSIGIMFVYKFSLIA